MLRPADRADSAADVDRAGPSTAAPAAAAEALAALGSSREGVAQQSGNERPVQPPQPRVQSCDPCVTGKRRRSRNLPCTWSKAGPLRAAIVNTLTVAENRREIVRLHAQIAVLVRVLRPSEPEMRVLMRRAMQPEPFGLRLPGFMVNWAGLEEQAEEHAPPPAAHRPHRTAEAAREASVAHLERRERPGYATEEGDADRAHEDEDEDEDMDEEEAAEATDVASETSDAEAPADEPDTPLRSARLDSGGRSFSLWGAP